MARFDRSQKSVQPPQIARKPGKERSSSATSTEPPSTGSQLQGVLGNRTMLTALTSDEAWNSLVEGALVLDDLGVQTPAAELLSNERMMGMLSEVGPGSDPFSGESSGVEVQAKGEEGEQGPSAGNLVGRAMSRGGRALPSDVRSEMESKFGVDFSGVRIHTDGLSGAASDAINARAFAVGPDIYFNAGEFNPGSSEGKFLLAHELTHVVQGGLAPAAKEKLGGVSVSSPSDPHEKEADAVALEIVRGTAGVALGRLGGGGSSALGRNPERSVQRFSGGSLPSGINRSGGNGNPASTGGSSPTVDLLQTRDISSLFTTQRQTGSQQQSGATGAGNQQGGTPTDQNNVQLVSVKLGVLGTGSLNVRKDAQGNISGGSGDITLTGGIFAKAPTKISLLVNGKGEVSGTATIDGTTLALGQLKTDGSITLKIDKDGFTGTGVLNASVGSLLKGQLTLQAGSDISLTGTLSLSEGSPLPGSGSLTVKHDGTGTKIDGSIHLNWGPLTGDLKGTKDGDNWSFGADLTIATGGGSGKVKLTVTDQGLMSGSGKLQWPIDENMKLDANASFDATGVLTLDGKLDVGQAWGAKDVQAKGKLTVSKEGKLSGSLTLSAEQVNIKGFSAQSGSVTVTFAEGTVDFAGAVKMAWGTLGTADIKASSTDGKLSFEGDFKLDVLGSHFDPESIKVKAADGQVTMDGNFGWTWNEKLKGNFQVKYADGLSGTGTAELKDGDNTGSVTVTASKEGQLSGSGNFKIKPFPWFGLDASVKVDPEGKITVDKVGAKASIKLPGVKDGAKVDVNGKIDDQSNFDGTIKIDVGSFTIPGVTFTGSGLTLGVHGGSADVESADLGVKTAIGEGQLSVKKEGEGLAFTTKIALDLPKIKEATVELSFRPNDIIEGEAKAQAELGGAKGAFDIHVKQEGEAGMQVWGEGSLEYKKGILDGKIDARMSKEKKWSGEGKLAAQITKNLKADADVQVSEEGKVKMGAEIALTKGLTLFEGKDKEFKSPEFSVSFPIFGFKIPFINVGVGITADISAGLTAKLGVKPAKIDSASLTADVEELGETPPVFELKGKASAGAYADLSLFVEGALSASAVIASLSGFLRMTGGLKAEADLSLDVGAKGSSPSDFVFDANAMLKAGLNLHADVTAGIKAKIGWGWLSKSKEWSKSLASWSYDTGQELECNAGVHYSQQEGVKVDFDYKAPDLDYKAMAENAAKKMM